MRSNDSIARFALAVMVAITGAMVILSAGSVSYGGILLHETWADGDHTNRGAGLPTESPVYSGHPGNISASPGQISTRVHDASMKLWTYFAADGAEPGLAVGERLVLTLDLVFRGTLYDQSTRSFRLGLYDDPTDPQIHENRNDDGGGDDDPWQDATGYAVQLALSSGPDHIANPIQLFKRVNTHASLLGSGGAMSPASSGGKPITFVLDRPYRLTLTLDYVSESRMNLNFSIADETGVLASQTVRDDRYTFGGGTLPDSAKPYTTFEQLFIRTGNRAGTADGIDYQGVKVEILAAPAPAP